MGEQPRGSRQHASSSSGRGLRRVTIRDVAEDAGVAISSVSRVLGNHPHVSDDLRRRVEAAVQKLGYSPNYVAHSLRRGDTLSVGFLVGAISNPIIADISAGASERLAAHGYATLLVCSENDPATDVRYMRFLAQRQVSGLIVSSAANGPAEPLRALIVEQGLPTIMLDRLRIAVPHVSSVMSDHEQGVQSAVAHLVAQGHRHIAYVGGLESFDPAAARLAGYRRGLEVAGLPVDTGLVYAWGMGRSTGHVAVHRMFSVTPRPTALIAGGNLLLTGVLQGLKDMRIQVGRDLALVGCDDTDLTRLHTPSISVIARDLRQVGRVAAEALLALLDGQAGQSIQLPTGLVVRESSRFSPAQQDPR